MPWNLPPTITTADQRTAAYFNKYRDCFGVLSQHTHSGLDGGGAVLSGRLGMMDTAGYIMFYSTWAYSVAVSSSGGVLGRTTWNPPPTSGYNPYIENKVFLRSGVYNFVVFFEGNYITAYLNNLIIGTHSAASPVTFEITVNSSGLQTVGFALPGSTTGTGYVNSFFFVRTGDLTNTTPPALTWNTRTFTPGEVLRASHLNQFRDNLDLLSNHTHTGESGQGSAVISGASDAAVLPQVQILARFPESTTGFTYSTSSNYRLGFVCQSSAQNDEIIFPVGLQAGTYRLEFLYGKGSNCGIATFYLDATSLGTIDTYNASTSYNDNGNITGITVAASGWYEFKIKMATKNASSSGYVCRWQAVNFVRTA